YSPLSDSTGAHTDWAHPQTTNALFGSLSGINDAGGVYPISDLEVYKQKMYVSVATPSTSVGPTSAGNGTSISGAGSLTWSNPTNITSSNNSYATRVMSGTTVTQYLRASNFGFALPAGATILGIVVEIERSRTGGSSGEVHDAQVKIVR